MQSDDSAICGNGMGGVAGVDNTKLSSLLQMWDLEEDDLCLKPSATDDVAEFPTEDSRVQPVACLPQVSNAHEKNPKYCDRCSASNVLHANWCFECGTAFISATRCNTSLIGDQTCLELEQKSLVHQRDRFVADCINAGDHQCSSLHWDSPSRSTPRDGLLRHSLPGAARVATPKRYWETSKSYAWRKPRSSVEHSHECKSQEILLNATPPVINATPVQVDTECKPKVSSDSLHSN